MCTGVGCIGGLSRCEVSGLPSCLGFELSLSRGLGAVSCGLGSASNRNEDYMSSSEPNSPTKANTEYPNTPEKQNLDLKSHLIMMLEDFKKDMKNSLREMQENINKQIEAYREE